MITLPLDSKEMQLDDLLGLICEELQLPLGKFRLAEERYLSIGEWLCEPGSRLALYKPTIYPQGSLSIGTAVRPRGREVHDLDLVCELLLDPRTVLNPLALLNALEARLRERGVYTLQRKNRCIRVIYASDFHMDLLIGVPDAGGNAGSLLVPDRGAEAWKASNPKGYALWFNSRVALVIPMREKIFANQIEPLPRPQTAAEKEPLRNGVQLFKRWRDIAFEKLPELAPISIVLTTLAGLNYSGRLSVSESLIEIVDKTVLAIDAAGSARMVVLNPTNQKEDFSERWDATPEAYAAFKSGIRDFQRRLHALGGHRGPQLVKALEEMFGESVTRNAVLKQTEAVTKAREAGILAAASTGILTVTSKARATPVPRNTFYGG